MSFGWSAPSEDELEGGDWTVLPEDEYIAKVTSVELKKDQPNRFPSKGDMEPTHDMLVLRAEAITFADGETLVDIEDKPVEATVPFQVWLNPKKRGMIPQPAKTRKAFAAILGQSIGDPIDIASFDELAGKQFIVSLKPNGSYNNAVDFRPVKRLRTRGTTTKGPIGAESLVDRAKEIFNEDAPDNVEPVKARGRTKPTADPVADGQDDLDF